MSWLWEEKGALAQAFGRSRGGFTSKVHARCDNQGLPIGFSLSGGNASDYAAVDDLMALPLPQAKALLADKRLRRRPASREPAHARHFTDHPTPVDPENFSPSRLSALQGSQPHRADVRQTKATAPHRHPLRQDYPVVRELPQPRPRVPTAKVLCQRHQKCNVSHFLGCIPEKLPYVRSRLASKAGKGLGLTNENPHYRAEPNNTSYYPVRNTHARACRVCCSLGPSSLPGFCHCADAA